MNIALHTMVKNGREKLPALFQSVKDFCDVAYIMDTGSDDGTQEWLRVQTLLPCEILQEPFENFEVSRTLGIEWAQTFKPDWLLLLDDDMRLKFTTPPNEIKDYLTDEHDTYLLRVEQAMTYWNTRIVRASRDWKYVGVTHEYLAGSEAAKKLKGVTVIHEFNHGPDKFTRDALLLATDIARDPDNPRTIFYLAQTFRDQGRTLAAIRYYELRVRMGGWAEEVFFSMYEAARLASDPKAMERAHAFRPSRAETAWWLREYYRVNNQPETSQKWEAVRATTPMTKDILFVHTLAYGN